MSYQRFAPQTDIPWRTYDVMDESHVLTLRDGGPFEITRRRFRLLPIRKFKWAMPFRTNVSSSSDDRQVIDAFLVKAREFSLQPFLVHDPKDPRELLVNIGTGDGSTTVFYFTTSESNERFRQYPYDDSTTIAYVDGSPIATGNRTIDTDNRKVTFSSAPANGKAVTISYDWYRLVLFDSPSMSWNSEVSYLASTVPDFTEIIRDGD